MQKTSIVFTAILSKELLVHSQIKAILYPGSGNMPFCSLYHDTCVKLKRGRGSSAVGRSKGSVTEMAKKKLRNFDQRLRQVAFKLLHQF